MFIRNTKKNQKLVKDLDSQGLLALAVITIPDANFEGSNIFKLEDGRWVENGRQQATVGSVLSIGIEVVPNWDSSDIIEAISFD
jgi:hypothetical protein